MAELTLADVPGLRMGHATDPVGMTGCTVVLATDGAVAGVDVRGAAPGTRETDLLRPGNLVERIHAVCLSGGSAFGLAAADGVMAWLAERGIGFATGVRPVPIVPAAVLFDLGVGSPDAVPDAAMGRAACDAADRGDGPLEGRVGAGAAATVGKLRGPAFASPGGVGSVAARHGDAVIGAVAVTNAVGEVVGRDGSVLAGVRADPGSGAVAPPFGNTTLAVIGTDAPLDRAQCRRLAELGHDALALAIRPVHTMFDGDVVFALSTGSGERLDPQAFTALGIAAVELLRTAIERSVSVAS